MIRLNVAYEPQTNNKVQPDRTFNTSACFMVARFLGAKIKSDDEYWKIVNKYGDSPDHSAQTLALAEIGIKSQWSTSMTFADLDKSLVSGLPIVVGILHRGDTNNPTGEHMIVVVGKEKDGYIVADPFGSILDNPPYSGSVMNGKNVKYPTWIFIRRWAVPTNGHGWGRTFFGNKG